MATGIRSVVAIDWNHADQSLYLIMHGRDDLLRLWAQLYTPWQSAILPAEEFLRITDGADFGWPYCYYDQLQNKKVLAPEYGGDGKTVGRCDQFQKPPRGLFRVTGRRTTCCSTRAASFRRYRRGAFITFHGATNRAPYPHRDTLSVLPFQNGAPTGQWEIFAVGLCRRKDPHCERKRRDVSPDGLVYRSRWVAI